MFQELICVWITDMSPPAPETRARAFLLLVTILIACLSALPYAGSWNDGSRLATVESLVDHGTWQIDDSIFVQTPRRAELPGPSPYAPNDPELVRHGTRDKLFIDGHYYSDKSPVPALAMASVYKLLQWSTGLTAAKTPGWFCYWMTLLFSGTAFVVSALCVDLAALRSGLPRGTRLLVTYSFVFATVALPYTRHVNNHILLLAVFALLLLALPRDVAVSVRRLVAAGTLAGIGYSIDLGVGPVLVLCTAGYLFLRTRSARALAVMLLCALPWFLAHHGLNYMIGGTFKPANAVPEYFAWPGSPFTERNLTGGWAHPDAAHFAAYAAGLLFGARGFRTVRPFDWGLDSAASERHSRRPVERGTARHLCARHPRRHQFGTSRRTRRLVRADAGLRGRAGLAAIPDLPAHSASREQHRPRPLFSGCAATARTTARRRRDAAVEFGRRRTCRIVKAARAVWIECAPTEPALTIGACRLSSAGPTTS